MRMIDADALKDRLQILAYDDWNQGIVMSYADALNEVVEMLDDAHTIEPERKKGKWIRIYSRPNVLRYLGWTCDQCEYRTAEEHAPQWFKFCPNCGAQMER